MSHGGQGQGGLETRPPGQRLRRALHLTFLGVFFSLWPPLIGSKFYKTTDVVQMSPEDPGKWILSLGSWLSVHRRLYGAGWVVCSLNSVYFWDREVQVQGIGDTRRGARLSTAVSSLLAHIISVKENGRFAPAWVAQAEKPWGSIRRDGLPARLGAHWEGGL